MHAGRQLYVTAGSLHTALLSLLDPFVTSELMPLQPSAEMYTERDTRTHRAFTIRIPTWRRKKTHRSRRVECGPQTDSCCLLLLVKRSYSVHTTGNQCISCLHTYGPAHTYTNTHTNTHARARHTHTRTHTTRVSG